MTSRLHISLGSAALLLASLLFARPLAAAGPGAASADDFFHGGAMQYLSNNIPAALDAVTNGLQRFPEDEKLKKLEELLKQQQQQQQQQQQDQQKQDQQKQDQQKSQDQKQQGKQDQQNQYQQKKDADQKKQGEQQQQADQKKDQQKQAQQSKPDERKNSGEQQQQAEAQPQRQMSPEQAQRVLDTMKGDEKVLPLQPVEAKTTSRPLKDW